jgi:hypothetical protein
MENYQIHITNSSQRSNGSVFEDQWHAFRQHCDTDESINNYCRSGSLRDSIFRSIAWRILLGSLPLNKDLWIQKAKQNRDNYKIWKEKVCIQNIIL